MCPNHTLGQKKSKRSPFDVAPIKNFKNWNPETVPQVESARKKMFQNCPPTLVNPNFFNKKIPKHKKNRLPEKKSFKSVAKHEKKWKHEMKIESHPLFSPLVLIFQFWSPVFQTLWKSEKRGRNPNRGPD